MKSMAINLSPAPEPILCGSVTKKEAAQAVSQGTKHIHSQLYPIPDSLVEQTTRALKYASIPKYHWELEGSQVDFLSNSADRRALIDKISHYCQRGKKGQLTDKLETISEELFSNALYHSTKTKTGEDQFSRSAPVRLDENCFVKVEYNFNRSGIFLSVTDRGGSLQFENLSQAFGRCYSLGKQIESKQGGAGLGFYMVFEMATHLKIEVNRFSSTRISVWIADHRQSLNHFSFNYFENEARDDSKR